MNPLKINLLAIAASVSYMHGLISVFISRMRVVTMRQTFQVDLQRLFSAPWEKPHMLYGRLLDWIRYLIVWHPAIIIIAQGINDYLGLK